MIVAVPLIVVFSLIIAMLINQQLRKRYLRTIFFLPVIISSGPILSELTAQGATDYLQ